MKIVYRLILIFLLGLIILSGLLLFLFRDQVLDFLREQANLSALIVPDKPTVVSERDTLDVGILKLPQFIPLTNNVINFDFDSICRRPTAATVVINLSGVNSTATGTAEGAATASPLNCVQGNNLPFFIKAK